MPGQTQSNIPADLLSRAVDQALQGDLDLKLVLDSLPLGIVILEANSGQYRIHLTNRMFDRQFKLSIKESVGQTLDSLPQLSDSSLPDQCDLVCESGDSAVFEWHQQKDSEDQFLSCTISPLNTDQRGPRLLLGTISDRSAEKRAELSLLHNALHDPLTDLPNRVLFQEMLEDELTEGKHREGNFAAVLLLNIDRFQLVNETLGHVAGDEFLVSVANRLSGVCGQDVVLARLSGDEFGVLARHLVDANVCLQLAEQVHAQMERPFSLGKLEFHASMSIGIATSESSPPYAEELIRDADFAMHRAKKNGRGSTVLFKRETHQRARSQLLLEVDLRKAIRQGEMELHYQPLIHLDSGKLKGFEALARWRHPGRGLIPPNEFISVAEECGLIVELGRWALLEACQQLRKWQQSDPECAAITMAVNVSGVQFASGNLVDDVEQALQMSGVSGDSIVIELTESAVMENPDRTTRILKQLSALGVKIALDDFGTGYSSLSYLQRFPLDIIKIDRSFVTNIGASDGNMKIVELVTLLGNALGLEIVAEGIETPEHLNHLRKLGCRIGQGFLFSKPMPQVHAERYIQDLASGSAFSAAGKA